MFSQLLHTEQSTAYLYQNQLGMHNKIQIPSPSQSYQVKIFIGKPHKSPF